MKLPQQAFGKYIRKPRPRFIRWQHGWGRDSAGTGQGLGGSLENVTVTGPLGAPVVCEYAIWEKRNIGGSGRIDFVGKEMMAVSENASVVENTSIIESKRGYKNEKKCGKTAIIEMAGAAGITLVPPELLNPINTTTYGVERS